MSPGYPFNFRSKGQRSRSQGHKMKKHISGNRVAGVSLHSIECRPLLDLRILAALFRQELPKGQLCRYYFYLWADFSVFRPTGATRCTDQGEIWQVVAVLRAIFQLDQLSGVGLITTPKTLKIWNFTNIIASKGRIP